MGQSQYSENYAWYATVEQPSIKPAPQGRNSLAQHAAAGGVLGKAENGTESRRDGTGFVAGPVNPGQRLGSKSHPDSREHDADWTARYRSRERAKVFGLLALVIFILALAFFRFGRTIPWGAR
jgi:hypothetical protein